MRGWVLVLAVGCGRSGFDPLSDASPNGRGDSVLDPFDAPPGSVVVTLGETPSADVSGVTQDTYLNSESTQATYNFGASASLSLEGSQKRSLLRFDVSAVPSGSQVIAARLHLWVAYKESGTPVVGLAPVLESWQVGTQNGAAGVANYTQRTTSQSWTTAGAGSPGSSGSLIASVPAAAVGLIGIDIPAVTVQGWVDTASTNFGLVLATTGGGGDLRLSSSEAATGSERPELVVTYYP